MTAEQFSRALAMLERRAARVSGPEAQRLTDRIVASRLQFIPCVDAQLSDLHWQLTLAELTHCVSRLECARPYILASPEPSVSPRAAVAG
jgi:hypothetical protein